MSGAKTQLTPGWRPMSVSLTAIGPDLAITLVDDVDLSKLFAHECKTVDNYSGPDLALWVQDDWCLGVRLASEAFRIDLYSVSTVSKEVAYVRFPTGRPNPYQEMVALATDRTAFRYPELLLDVVSPGRPSGLEVLWPREVEAWGPPPL